MSSDTKYRYTKHAMERWTERGSGGSIGDAISKAVPFGAQYGDSIYLRDGKVVFVVKQPSTVVTVLSLNKQSRTCSRLGSGWIQHELPAVSSLRQVRFEQSRSRTHERSDRFD